MDIRRRVKNLVKKWGTRDPRVLCRYMKITVLYRDLGNVKGYYTKCLRRKFIFINENLDEFSQRVVLAHELGHALLHGKDVIMMKGYFTSCKDSLYEREANKFAAELLLVEEEVDYQNHTEKDREIMELVGLD
ncbi:MAG: ImmA/IrrE family metallo-endopeptidase [Cetobacterium sp.]